MEIVKKTASVIAWLLGIAASTWACIEMYEYFFKPDPSQVQRFCYRDDNGDGRGDPNVAIPWPENSDLKEGYSPTNDDPYDSIPLLIVTQASIELFPVSCGPDAVQQVRFTVRAKDDIPVSNKLIELEVSPPSFRQVLVLEGTKLSGSTHTVITDANGSARFTIRPNAPWPSVNAKPKIHYYLKANVSRLDVNQSKDMNVHEGC